MVPEATKVSCASSWACIGITDPRVLTPRYRRNGGTLAVWRFIDAVWRPVWEAIGYHLARCRSSRTKPTGQLR